MQTIFDSRTLPAAKRYKAWQDAICEIYFQVDCTPEERDDYDGLVREARFGPLILTDTLSAPQVVLRQNRHISRLDKDCYILGLPQYGRGGLCQRDASFTMHTGAAGLFYASEPYDLRGKAPVRAFWMEIPQRLLASRFSSGRAPVNTMLNVERGLGRIAAEFCNTLAAESALLDDEARAKLGDEFLDILAAAVDAGFDREPTGEKTVRKARLRSVKAYIDAHLREPDLTLEFDRKEQRHLAALFARAVHGDGQFGLRLDLAQAVAAMPCAADPSRARRTLDHRDRVLDGLQQLLALQQPLPRGVRVEAVRRQAQWRRKPRAIGGGTGTSGTLGRRAALWPIQAGVRSWETIDRVVRKLD